MDTIIYQGQEIEAEVIGQVDRRIDCGSPYNASDSLLRDEAGFYYVQREILEAVRHPTTEALQTRVHRVGINAAILWAITELGNGDSWALRCDASNLITPERGYDDPNDNFTRYLKAKQEQDDTPEYVPPKRRVDGPLSSVTTEGWFQGCIQPEEGSGARVSTIFDLDPLHAALLKVFTERHGINVAVLMRACLVYELEDIFDLPGNGGEEEEAVVSCLSEYGRLTAPQEDFELRDMAEAAGLDPESFTPLPTTPKTTGKSSVDKALLALLDENALAMLHRAVQENPKYSVADYVNAGVLFMLSKDEDDVDGERSFCESSACMETAKAIRLKAEKNAPKPPSVTFPPALESYGVSQQTLEAAARYAAKYGRTVDEMLKDMLECAAENATSQTAPKAQEELTRLEPVEESACTR